MMAEVVRNFNKWFWNEKVWLPPNTTWADRISTPINQYPNYLDLWTYPFALAIAFNIIRFRFLNPYVFGSIANYYGVKNIKPKSVVPNHILEVTFNEHNRKVPEAEIAKTARTLRWPERKVQRWMRVRCAMNKVNTYTKFLECSWQLTYYSFSFLLGIYVLSDKAWLYDSTFCWRGYPHLKLHSDIWWYYMISLGFYWGMTATHFLETRRKDFLQMLVHHLITIALIVFSFICNFVRIGSLVLLVHDAADIPLQLSKLFIYLDWKRHCDLTFTVFAIVWVVTRCIIFPFYIVGRTLDIAHTDVPMHPAYYIFNCLLGFLIALHYYWTYFIMRMIFKGATEGKIEDDRSNSDEFSQDDKPKKKII